MEGASDLQGSEHLLGQGGWLETEARSAVPGYTPCTRAGAAYVGALVQNRAWEW